MHPRVVVRQNGGGRQMTIGQPCNLRRAMPIARSAIAPWLFAATVILVWINPPPLRAEECAICDREVVLDRRLAACFLERYGVLQTGNTPAVVVDLSECPELEAGENEESSRGVVEALQMPDSAPLTPDPTFMISRAHLNCLKSRLEHGEVALDPAARIALDSCE